MAWVGLVAWAFTAGGGAVLGVLWLRHGGAHQRSGIRSPRLLTHIALAVSGLTLWFLFALTERAVWGWLALGLLAVVVAVGVSMLLLWLRGRSEHEATELPAETAFPLPVVLGHGVLGATTLVLCVVAVLTQA